MEAAARMMEMVAMRDESVERLSQSFPERLGQSLYEKAHGKFRKVAEILKTELGRVMMRRLATTVALVAVMLTAIGTAVVAIDSSDATDDLQQANQLLQDKNFAEAAEKFRSVIRNQDAASEQVIESMRKLLDCQRQLGIESEIDADLAMAISAHPDDLQVLDMAATQISQVVHYGTVADQKFSRGYQGRFRGRGPGIAGGPVAGTTVYVLEQDRLQALRWRLKAIELALLQGGQTDSHAIAKMQLSLVETIQLGRTGMQAWKLQSLTDLTAEPNYLDLSGDEHLPARYAPVSDDGEPVLYGIPESWEIAQSDGERMRWALAQAELSNDLRWESKMRWADFLSSQFSVETLQQDRWLFREQPDGGKSEGVFSIHTLEETETIARLATGIKRLSLSDEFNFIRIYQQLADSEATAINERAAWSLVQIFLNRRQYATAAEQIEAYIKRFGDDRSGSKQQLLDSIRQPRMSFDPVPSQLAGRKATLSLLFRNATHLSFTAWPVDVERILFDTKEYYRRFDPREDNRRFGGRQNESPPNLVSPVSLFDEARINGYLLKQVAQWNQDLEPRPNHWDKRVEIETPLVTAGLYLIEALADDGQHKARCLVWIEDMVLVQTPLDDKWLLHAADAEGGKPIVGANIELFGFGHEQQPNRPRPRLLTENFAVRSNERGLVEVALRNDFQWLCVARTNEGRLALLNFEHVFRRDLGRQNYGELKAYGVSDRPLYRPGETVNAKFWLGYATYGDVAGPRVANTEVVVTLMDPQGNQIAERKLETDEYGGCDLQIELPGAAPLGHYRFQVQLASDPRPRRPLQTRKGSESWEGNRWVNTPLTIRVEEYRKPEFEVNILAPEKPVALGETIKARIEAKYYFGAPVTDAVVTVKVERSTYRDHFYPIAPYDWCYGPGYWWFAEDYEWYPGWARWHGCIAPLPGLRPRWGFEPPELVLEQELQLDSTGRAIVEIDTALAKVAYGDENHKYTISVDVRDSSRRTISSQGAVFVAQEPFDIYSWTDRGYYYVGDQINAHFQARMLDGTPVAGSGTVELLRITYDAEMTPHEQVVATFDAKLDQDGRYTQAIAADRPGQYRVRLRVTDEAEHTVEGAYVFIIRGEGTEGNDFRFNALELIPDKQHYAPGETVKLQIASNRADALVALFLRPTGGTYQPPQWVQLVDKSAIVEIEVAEGDQPNFFVEAYTIYDGEFHHEAREIIVPPADRVLNVEVVANKSEYLPGEEAKVELTVTDDEGKPAAGSCVIAAYDRSLEQIANDVLPQDIREFFWKWRRDHSPRHRVNIDSITYPIQIQGQPALDPLGIFGSSLADDLDAIDGERRLPKSNMERSEFGRGALGGATMDAAMAPMMMMEARGRADGAAAGAAAPQNGAANGNVPQVRKDFADSALWLANLKVDDRGHATTTFKMPENLTSWKLRAWTVGEETRVGSASTEAVTRKPLLVRLQTPRFLVERDEVVISAIVHNDLPEKRTIDVTLEIDGETQLELLSDANRQQTVVIESLQQSRVDWRCRAVAEGTAILRTFAVTQDASDAMQLEVPIVVNGILKMDAWAGTVRTGQRGATVTIDIPDQRRVEQSRLTVRLSPSLAAAMIDALPYLAEYPYGCTEQTLNRFLPSVITQRVLQQMNVDLQQLKQKRNNLNAQELGDPDQRRERWKRFDRTAVFDDELVADMVDAGVRRLADMQNADGGWGWFSGIQEHSGAHTTAIVVRGLLVAQQNEVPIVPDVIQRGVAWLEQYQQAELRKLQNADGETKPFKLHPDNVDALVFHVLVLADRIEPAMQQILYDQREHLSTYGKALLAWATFKAGNLTQTNMLRRNIEQFLVEDAENETAFLRDQTAWWYWYGSEIEANAVYLKLLSALEPDGRVAPRIVKYLLNNRKHATYWNSTRDTALVVEAFADYIAASGEIANSMTAEVWLAEKRLGTIEFTPQNLFDVNNTIEIYGAAIPPGKHSLEIRRAGEGNLYWNAYATNFTLEEEMAPAGLEVKIQRRYYHLEPATKELSLPGTRANVVDARRSTFERTLMEDLGALPSGELVEVELLIDSKNDYEYLVIEDYKPASLEAVETQSGYFYDAGLSIYRELRDKHVGLCIRWLPRGSYSIRYQLRSEAPGQFTALPAVIQGMYAPELRGNSADFDLSVVE